MFVHQDLHDKMSATLVPVLLSADQVMRPVLRELNFGIKHQTVVLSFLK